MPAHDDRVSEAPEQRAGELDARSRRPGSGSWGRACSVLPLGRPEFGKSWEWASLAWTTRRVEALKRGLQVVRVRMVGEDVVDHVGVAGRHDEALGGVVDEDALQRGEDDGVADLDRVEVVEGVAVGGAVPGDGGVAGLARERRADVVARALAQVGRVGALDDDLVDADHRDADVADGLALGRVLAVVGAVTGGPVGSLSSAASSARAWRTCVAVGLLLELGAQPGLGVGLLNGGAPDLVRREEEQRRRRPR